MQDKFDTLANPLRCSKYFSFYNKYKKECIREGLKKIMEYKKGLIIYLIYAEKVKFAP